MTDRTLGAAARVGLPRRDRLAILAALAGVSAVAWLYLYLLAADMAGVAMAAQPAAWTAADFVLMVVMWWVMMVGMMLPSAAPMLLTFATINAKKRARGQAYVPTAVFALGYLAAWGGFSLAATAAQWGLEQAALLTPMMRTASPILGALLFAAAGIYQFTPLKYACLSHCRSPFDFILNHWRDGGLGALRMGIGHGLYCLGCCWVLMALLFVGGVMNLLWVAALAALVFVEKLLPGGQSTARGIARAGGALMIAFGGYLLYGA